MTPETLLWLLPLVCGFSFVFFVRQLIYRRRMRPIFWRAVDMAWVLSSALAISLTVMTTRADSLYETYFSLYREVIQTQIQIQKTVNPLLRRRCGYGQWPDEPPVSAEFLQQACHEARSALVDAASLNLAYKDDMHQDLERFPLTKYWMGHSSSAAEAEVTDKLSELRYLKEQFNIYMTELEAVRDALYPFYFSVRKSKVRSVWQVLYMIMAGLRLSRSWYEIGQAREDGQPKKRPMLHLLGPQDRKPTAPQVADRDVRPAPSFLIAAVAEPDLTHTLPTPSNLSPKIGQHVPSFLNPSSCRQVRTVDGVVQD